MTNCAKGILENMGASVVDWRAESCGAEARRDVSLLRLFSG